MSERTTAASDAARVADEMSGQRGALLLDRPRFEGQLVIERFTPHDDMELDRPLVVLAEIAALHRQPRGDQAHLEDLEAELAAMRTELLVAPNLITQVGDQYYGERAAGIGGAPGQVTGMRLGTGSTAASKTGAGAAIVTYISGSSVAIDGSYPQSALSGGSRRITWRTTWNPGIATATGINEVVLTNETPLTDVAGSAANTIARVVLSPVINKGASDTLTITWNHDLLGS